MPGATLSRWTLSFFAVALSCLMAAEVLMVAGVGYPAAPLAAPETLFVVHLAAIGWLSLLMCGALLQFLPVLVAQPLFSDRLSLPALLLLVAGLACLLGAFAEMGGHVDSGLPLFALASILLAAGFALVLWNLARTVMMASIRPLPILFVIAGLVSLVATVALGASFATVLGGNTQSGALAALTAEGIPVHAVAGLGGWLTFSAMGVSYRLLAMFMLAPELERATTKAAFWLGVAALVLAILGGTAAIVLGARPGKALLAALALAVAGLACYGADMITLYRRRRRPLIELNSRMAAWALGALALAVVLGAVLVALGLPGETVGAPVFLVIFGWLTGLGLAQLYKIVAFVTWLETYGPVLGRQPTPRVQDLVVEKRARRWFHAHFAGAGLGTLALLAGQATAFRLAALVMLVAALGLAVEFLRTRRLADVAPALRQPEGTRLPALLRTQAG